MRHVSEFAVTASAWMSAQSSTRNRFAPIPRERRREPDKQTADAGEGIGQHRVSAENDRDAKYYTGRDILPGIRDHAHLKHGQGSGRHDRGGAEPVVYEEQSCRHRSGHGRGATGWREAADRVIEDRYARLDVVQAGPCPRRDKELAGRKSRHSRGEHPHDGADAFWRAPRAPPAEQYEGTEGKSAVQGIIMHETPLPRRR